MLFRSIKRFESTDGKVWSFDRHAGTIEQRSPKTLMQLFNLYTVQPSGVDDTTLESVDLAKIDNDGANAFGALLNGDHSQAAKLRLAEFFAVQVMRDPDTVTAYGPKAQEFTLGLLEVFDAPDYATFVVAFSAKFPGPEMVKQSEYNYIKSLDPLAAEQALELIIVSLDPKGGLPDLPFTDLVRSPSGRDVVRAHLLSFQWMLKISSSLSFVLGDTGILAERGDIQKLTVPLSNTSALYLVPSDNPTPGVLVHTAAKNDVEALNWESAARARRWLVGDKAQLVHLKDQVGKDLSVLK